MLSVHWMSATACLLFACRGEPQQRLEERAQGMKRAQLDLESRVAVYDAAIRKSFDVGPGLYLQLHPRQLPRTGGFEGGEPVDSALGAALRGAGLVRGTCNPQRESEQRAPLCDDGQSGYIVRGSEIFQRGGDTLQLYLHAEVFAPLKGRGTSPFMFEMAYRLVPGGNGRFRVAAEGRVRQKG